MKPDNHYQLTSAILSCCFEIMNQLGSGFLESVYKNALLFALRENEEVVEIEQSFEIYFKQQRVGFYKADMVVQNSVIIELKCCKSLLP